jgi:hypothetical protein
VTVSRTVVPGAWYGVLGDSVIVLLPAEAKARVAGLWETVDEGAGFDEVLDALISDGLRSLPSFVLVSGEGRDVKVVIRGAGEAELTTPDGPVVVSGTADTTWVERNVSGVTGLRVQVAEGEGPPYAVGSGLVRVASVEHPARAAEVAPDDAPPAAEPATVVAPPVVTADAPARAVAVPIEPPAPEREPEPERPARILPPDPLLEAERQAAEAAAEAAAAEPQPPEEPAPTPVAPIPGAPVPVPYDPLTSPDLAVTPVHSRSDTTRDSGAGESLPTSGAVARLVFSSGEIVDVDRAVVVGRAPEHGRFGSDEQTRLVTVPSPHQEISSTHLEVRPGTGSEQGSAVVTDLGSTNGTVVAQPGQPAEDLRPGVAVPVVPGATIDLGEGVTIQVTEV